MKITALKEGSPLWERAEEIHDEVEARACNLYQHDANCRDTDLGDWIAAEDEALLWAPTEVNADGGKVFVRTPIKAADDSLEIGVAPHRVVIHGRQDGREILREAAIADAVLPDQARATVDAGMLQVEIPMERRTRIAVKNILLATDFSPSSEAATAYAETIARKYNAKIFVTHIVSPENFAFLPPEVSSIAFDELWEAGNDELARVGATALRKVPHEALLAEGEPASALRRIVEEKHIDLVIAGSHGHKGITRFLLGSVTESLLKHAPCPVLIVGPHAPDRVSKSSHLRGILYATDFSTESLRAFPYALDLARENRATLTLLTVLAAADATSAYCATLHESALRRLRQLVPEAACMDCDPRFLVEFGPVAETIKNRAAQEHADLIVLGGRSPHFRIQRLHLAAPRPSGRITYAVVSEAPCAVLSVPESAR